MDALINGKEAASGPAAITVETHKHNFRANMEHSQTKHQKILPDG